MNQQVCKFVEEVTAQIKYKKVRPHIAAEIEDHIEMLKEDYVREGLSNEEAYQKAIKQMGDAKEIGQELHKTHKPHNTWSVMLLLAILIGIGIYTMGIYQNSVRNGPYFFRKQMFCTGIGTIGFLAAFLCDYKKFEKWSVVGYIAGILLLIYQLFFGATVNGANRWIRVGGISFLSTQPAMLFLVTAFSGLMLRIRAHRLSELAMLLGLIALPVWLILCQPYTVRALSLAVTLFSLFVFYICSSDYKGNRTKCLAAMGTVAACGAALAALTFNQLLADYQKERIMYFLNRANDPDGGGYIYAMIKKISEGTKWIGSSSGMSALENGLSTVLPYPFNEYFFIVISSSLGRAVGLLIIAIIAGILIKMFLGALKIRDLFGRLICFGISVLFTAQFVVNIMMNLGLLPFMGSELPFVSYGGTSLIINMTLMGLMLGIYRRKDLVLITC